MRPAVTKAVTEGSLLSKLADAQEPFWVAVSDAIATVAADQIQRTPDYPSIVTSGGSDPPLSGHPPQRVPTDPPTERREASAGGIGWKRPRAGGAGGADAIEPAG
jgi:hypothetical protein